MRNILRIQVVHDLRVIDKRDGVIVLVDGRVSEFGLWQSIFDNPSTEWLRRAVELL
jgi:ABC-type microcin C transport system duplicated ATPase subunit YejF